jgi:hypothetical protein
MLPLQRTGTHLVHIYYLKSAIHTAGKVESEREKILGIFSATSSPWGHPPPHSQALLPPVNLIARGPSGVLTVARPGYKPTRDLHGSHHPCLLPGVRMHAWFASRRPGSLDIADGYTVLAAAATLLLPPVPSPLYIPIPPDRRGNIANKHRVQSAR